MTRNRTVEYSGMPFGQPNTHLLAAIHPSPLVAATPVLNGADSVTASSMDKGLDFYCGYSVESSFFNISEVMQDYPGKKYIEITPFRAVPRDCLDIEPGDSQPSDAPGFVRDNPKPVHVTLPMLYASAGDVQAVINALTSAGFPRSSYLIFSAHWIGRHICSPTICGFPQADLTQWQNLPSEDLDAAYSYVFTPAVPPPPSQGPTGLGAKVVASNYQLNMSWDAARVNPRPLYHWQVQVKTATGWTPAGESYTTNTVATSRDLPPGHQGQWRVRGGIGDIWSPWQSFTIPS